MATINSNARQNSFFPSNVKLPNHLNNRMVFEDNIYSNEIELNDSIEETREYITNNDEKNVNSTTAMNTNENNKKSEPIEVMVQKFVKKNDKMLLLALAFFLYKQEADIMIVLALCYLAL